MVTAVAPTAATPGRDGAAREATKVVPMPGSSRRCQCLGSGASVQAPRFRRIGRRPPSRCRPARGEHRGARPRHGTAVGGLAAASSRYSGVKIRVSFAFLDRKLSGLLPPSPIPTQPAMPFTSEAFFEVFLPDFE